MQTHFGKCRTKYILLTQTLLMPPSGGTEPVTAGIQPFQSGSEINININSKGIKSNIYGAIAYASIYFSVY